MSLLDVLGAAGDVIDTPRHLLWKHGISNLFGQEMNGGSDLLAALGADPEDFLTQAGGFGLDLATDPLTYLGGALAAKAPAALRRAGALRMGRVGQEAEAPVMKMFSGMGLPSIDREVALERGLTTGRADLKPLEYLPTQAKTMAQAEKIGAGEGSKATSSLQAQREAEIAQRLAGEEAQWESKVAVPRYQALEERRARPLEMFPPEMTQADFEGKLNQLYGVARDFEGDVAAGGLPRGTPYATMGHRHSLWDEILGGETEFARRLPNWNTDIDVQNGLLNYSNPARETLRHRNLTPEIVEQVVERSKQAMGEEGLLPHFRDAPPNLRDLLGEQVRGRMSAPIAQPVPPGQDRWQRLGVEQLRQGMGRFDMPEPLAEAYRNAQWRQGLYDSQHQAMLAGFVGPGDANQVMASLVRAGYPVNEPSMLDVWRKSFMKQADRSGPDVARLAANMNAPGFPTEATQSRLASMFGPEMLQQMLATPDQAQSMIRAFLATLR